MHILVAVHIKNFGSKAGKNKLTHVMSELYGEQTVAVSVVTHGHALYTVTVVGAGTGLQHGRHCNY